MGTRDVNPNLEAWGGHMEDPEAGKCPASSSWKPTTFEPFFDPSSSHHLSTEEFVEGIAGFYEIDHDLHPG